MHRYIRLDQDRGMCLSSVGYREFLQTDDQYLATGRKEAKYAISELFFGSCRDSALVSLSDEAKLVLAPGYLMSL